MYIKSELWYRNVQFWLFSCKREFVSHNSDCFSCNCKLISCNSDFFSQLRVYISQFWLFSCNCKFVSRRGGTVLVSNRTVHEANSKWKWSSLSPWSGDFGVSRAPACHYLVVWNALGKGRDVISSLTAAAMFPWQRSKCCVVTGTSQLKIEEIRSLQVHSKRLNNGTQVPCSLQSPHSKGIGMITSIWNLPREPCGSIRVPFHP